MNYRSPLSIHKYIILLRYISKVAHFTRCKCDKIVSKSRGVLHLTFRCRQQELCPSSFQLRKYNLKNLRLHYTGDKKLAEGSLPSPDLMGAAWGKSCRAISAAAPLTILFSVSEAITGQQSTTAPQLSCLWFLIKTKRRDPSKTLFAFQATRVIIFVMDTIKMYEKWSHYYSLL